MRNVPAGFDVLAKVTPVDASLLGATSTVGSRGRSIAPMVTDSKEYWYEAGNEVKTSTSTLTYDDLGDVLTQLDGGEPTTRTTTSSSTTDYSRCLTAASTTSGAPSRPAARQPVPDLLERNLCPTWVSLPVEITVTNGKTGAARKVLPPPRRARRHLRQRVGDAPRRGRRQRARSAETELTYDAWGSYDRIVYPVGPNGRRYAVQYVWDLDGHAKIAQVTEYDLYDIPDNSVTWRRTSSTPRTTIRPTTW